MSAILKFDFQKRKQLCFSEVNYLKYTHTHTHTPTHTHTHTQKTLKVNISQTLVEPVLLYGSEKLNQTSGDKFGWLLYQAFQSSPKHQLKICMEAS